MNNSGAGFIGFIIGAAVGSGLTWYIVKQKYARVDISGNISKEELDSLREKLKAREKVEPEQDEEEKKDLVQKAIHKPSITEYADILKKENYVNYSDRDPNSMDNNHQMKKNSRVESVSPSEFGENEDYEKVVLMYYADDILADDESGEIVDNPDYLVGNDFANHFGDYEADTVFIRNDTEETYYEICRDDRTYDEVVGSIKPKPVEVQ